jgi:hypothetical protein
MEQLRADLKQLEIRDLKDSDRRGYASRPSKRSEADWEVEAAWRTRTRSEFL